MAITVNMGDPLPQSKPLVRQLAKPAETVTLLGLVPGANASLAALRWTNPPEGAEAGRQAGSMAGALRPECMEILALDMLPANAAKQLDVAAAHTRMRELLPPPGTPRHLSLTYVQDNVQATMYATQHLEDPTTLDRVLASLDAADAAVAGLPTAFNGHVLTSSMARTLQLKAADMKKKVALETAWAVFPQARPMLKTVVHDGPQAQALLVLAHVVGARIARGGPAAAPDLAPAAAAGAGAAREPAPAAAVPRARAPAGAAAAARAARAAAPAPAAAAGAAAAAAAAAQAARAAAPAPAVPPELAALAAAPVDPSFADHILLPSLVPFMGPGSAIYTMVAPAELQQILNTVSAAEAQQQAAQQGQQAGEAQQAAQQAQQQAALMAAQAQQQFAQQAALAQATPQGTEQWLLQTQLAAHSAQLTQQWKLQQQAVLAAQQAQQGALMAQLTEQWAHQQQQQQQQQQQTQQSQQARQVPALCIKAEPLALPGGPRPPVGMPTPSPAAGRKRKGAAGAAAAAVASAAAAGAGLRLVKDKPVECRQTAASSPAAATSAAAAAAAAAAEGRASAAAARPCSAGFVIPKRARKAAAELDFEAGPASPGAGGGAARIKPDPEPAVKPEPAA